MSTSVALVYRECVQFQGACGQSKKLLNKKLTLSVFGMKPGPASESCPVYFLLLRLDCKVDNDSGLLKLNSGLQKQ